MAVTNKKDLKNGYDKHKGLKDDGDKHESLKDGGDKHEELKNAGGELEDLRKSVRTFLCFIPFLDTIIILVFVFNYLMIIVDMLSSKLTELCMFLLSPSPTSLMVLILRQVPRKVRSILSSTVVLYRIFGPDRID